MERNFNYSRSSSYPARHASKRSRYGSLIKKIDKKVFERMVNQFIISLVISFAVIIISNFSGSFIESAIGGIKWVTGTNYDFAAAVNSILPGINDEISKIPGLVGDILDGGGAVDAVSSNSASAMIMPIEGKIIMAFGANRDSMDSANGKTNMGIVIAADEGTPVKSVMDGVVLKIEENQALGRIIRVKHNYGLETLYAHCSEILVDENQTIKQGEYVAKAGHTGSAAASQLYFEVIKDGIQIDPLSVIGNTAQAK